MLIMVCVLNILNYQECNLHFRMMAEFLSASGWSFFFSVLRIPADSSV